MEVSRKKGSRFIGAIISLLIILFLVIEFFIRRTQEFSIARILLLSLEIIFILLFLILSFVLGRNLIKLSLERKRKVAGAHFKTRLFIFFISLSLIPTMLLFFFASDIISRNIEGWFQTPIDQIMDDTENLASGFYLDSKDISLHYAQQLVSAIQEQNLIDLDRRLPLMTFVRNKLTEYKLDEIGIYKEDEELFSYLNPDLPFQYYQDLKTNMIKRAHLGENLEEILSMGSGELIRRGISFNIPEIGSILVVTGKFLPQNYAQRIKNITSYVERYRQLRIQRNPVKTSYFLLLALVTLLIIFAASWIGMYLAKGITVPIEKLAQATKEVSKGNLDVHVEDPASDELGTLIDSFNQMIADLKGNQQNLAQKTTELAEGKKYIETILDNITTGVITLDAKGTITTINPSAQEMLLLNDLDLVGKQVAHVLKDSKYEDITKSIQLGINNDFKVRDKEINIQADSQNIMLALTVSPLRQANDELSGIIVVLDNLTQLIKAQKVAAWKEVAQRVAHEIKNPLTPIQLSAERIIKNLKKDGQHNIEIIQEGAATIVQEARTIKALVDEFSNFARLPNIRLESSDIHEIIEQSISPYLGIFNDIKFETRFSSEIPPSLLVDSDQMKRVFMNIFDNAIDAMEQKGTIKIKTFYDRDTKKLSIEISDQGPGIAVEDKDKIFLPDYSTKKKGTGLGLAIVNQVIVEHNGSIDFSNIDPHGAKFTIKISA
ncbi:MAG: ATP-binding protein [Candidatus Aminicenantes bacterium]|nr:ATP-binding protein [Candidatus Aminicenantes bacterium]